MYYILFYEKNQTARDYSRVTWRFLARTEERKGTTIEEGKNYQFVGE